MKIYLAGPDVFRENAVEHGEYLKQICSEQWVTGLYPMDKEIENFSNNAETAIEIFRWNIELIIESDAILANMQRFRWPSMDVWTAWEMWMWYGLKKYIVWYNTDHQTMIDFIHKNDIVLWEKFPHVENFWLSDNLMTIGSCDYIAKNFREALLHIVDQYNNVW